MHILTALDTEWITLGTSPTARRALRSWTAAEPILAGHDSPAALLVACKKVGVDALGHEALAALCRLGATDELARRTALQLCIPIIARRARTLWRARGANPTLLDDIEAEAVTAALTRIADMATTPASRPVYAVEGSVRNALATFTRSDQRNAGIPLEDHGGAEAAAPDAGELLLSLVVGAVHARRITSSDARLVVATRIGAESIRSISARTGEHYKVISRRRLAAEQSLSRWAA